MSNSVVPQEDELDEITVCWSEEKFAPVSYHSFGIGPFYMKTKVKPGETPEEAFQRAWDVLDKMARQMYPAKRNGFFERLNYKG